MNIAYITHLYPTIQNPSYGIFMWRFVEMMKEKGFEFDVLVPTVRSLPLTSRWNQNHSELLSENAQRTYYSSIPRRLKPKYVRNRIAESLKKQIKRIEPDVVHVNWIYPDGLAVPEIKKMNLPVILQIHGADWYENIVNYKMKPLIADSLKSADQIWVVGSSLKEDISNTFNWAESKIKVVPNAINCSLFQVNKNKQELQKQLGWSKDHVHILQVAHFRREKGQIDLVEAFKLLRFGKKVCLHLIGAAYDITYFKEVKREIRHHQNLNIQIHSPLPPEELPEVMSAADLFVLPSRVEGFGVALIEAGACGIPLLSTKSGGPKDIISSDIGLLAEPSSPKSLAKNLDEMLFKLYSFNSNDIKASIEKRFDNKVVSKYTKDLYKELII